MAVPVNTEVSYGWLGVNRFAIRFSGSLTANQTSTYSCTFNLVGTWYLTIYSVGTQTRVVYPASDYIAFVKGGYDLAATGSGATSNAYKAGLPYGINASTGDIICETRVDSYRYGDANSGAIWNRSTAGIGTTQTIGTHTCAVNETFTLALNGSGEQIVLRYFSSGSDRNNISWITSQAWNYIAKVQNFIDEGSVQFDYRPGERLVNGTWRSHDHSSGWAERLNGSWYEMRTVDGGTGTGDPPERKISGSWKNQSKIGAT